MDVMPEPGEKNDSFRSRAQLVLLPALALIVVGAIAAGILAIVVLPGAKNSQMGVGADGFRAYVEDGTDLGIKNVVSRGDVAAALGNKAKSVSDAKISKVFNYNGNRGQTATFGFVRADGVKASVYVDVLMFPNTNTMNAANLYSSTLKAKNPINGYPAYYMLAQTLAGKREYRLMVINGLKAYKFVMDQPVNNITLNEVSALASLTKVAQKAHL